MVKIGRKSTVFEAYSTSHFIETETQFLQEIHYLIEISVSHAIRCVDVVFRTLPHFLETVIGSEKGI